MELKPFPYWIVFRWFDKMDDALAFEQELKNASASEAWDMRSDE